MKTMNAFVRIDAVSQKVELAEVSIPEILPEEVLIKVGAFGVGIHDRYFIPGNIDFPYIIGSEGAGIIVQLGTDVNGFSIGDRVIFSTILQPQGGSWAEYAVSNPSVLIPLPDNLTFVQGAALPIAGGTAIECMRVLSLERGDTLFIAGASGAIGTFVIQMAAAKGIRIAASASEKNHTYMKSLGVEKAVDYTNINWINEVLEWSEKGVTAALAIQPGTGKDSIEVVKDGGRLITVSGDNAQVIPIRNIEVKQVGHQSDKQQKLMDLVDAISKNEIQVIIEKEYPFKEALSALEKTETRHARGKMVVML